MKKIKLLASLSTLGVLGSGVAFSATSCSSNDENNGSKILNSASELNNWVNTPLYAKKEGYTKNIINNPANILDFLETEVAPAHIAHWLAWNYNEGAEEALNPKFDIKWKTESDKITVSVDLTQTTEGQSQTVVHSYTFTKENGKKYGKVVMNMFGEISTSSQIQQVQKSLDGALGFDYSVAAGSAQSTIDFYLLPCDFPPAGITIIDISQ